MSMKKNEIFVLNETEEKKNRISEPVLIFLVLAGILLFLRDFSYSVWCLAAAFFVGAVVTVLYCITERSEKAAGRMKTILYVSGIALFLVTITVTTQGIFYLADCFLGMWNSRFGTEATLFAVGSNAGIGSVILWALFAEAVVSFLFSQVKKNNIYGIMIFMIPSAACGLILGSSSMWLAFLLSLAGFFGVFIVYSTRGRNFGLGEISAIALIAVVVGVVSFLTGGYQKSVKLEQWKQKISADVEKFRYGEDSLPQGDLRKEEELLDREEETLKLTMNQPQELYLRGFVGGSYDGMQWNGIPYSSYEGEYEGMLRWRKQNSFSPLSQFAVYDKLNAQASGNNSGYMQVSVENTGAYRKYVYLPAVAEAWENGVEHKDWNVESRSFFGARRYQFQVSEGEATADSMIPGNWLENPSDSRQESYVKAENVYHSFVLDSYTDISDELKERILAEFFAEDQDPEEMDFDELTTQIRQALRNHIRYTDIPQDMPENEDMVNWILDGQKEGNAVAFATAAVMAYRAAGYPARYTEGYHLSDMDAQAASDAGEKEVILTTKNAHAWAEVYIAGLGWMPVEVVPGLYTETYTDQLVEGKPSYRVNTVRDENGADTTDQGTGNGTGKSETKVIEKHTWKTVPGVIVLVLYGLFLLYLILELQRAARIKMRKNLKKKYAAKGQLVEWYVDEIENLFAIGGVKGDLTDPTALFEEVKVCFPGIREEEYFRSGGLIQKYRFGGMELMPHELRVLRGMTERFRQCLYKKQHFPGKLRLRYFYAR